MSNYSLCVIAAMFYAILGLAGVTFFGVPFESVHPVLFLCTAAICDSIEKSERP